MAVKTDAVVTMDVDADVVLDLTVYLATAAPAVVFYGF